MYSASSLTDDEALHIADAYFRSGKDPKRMAVALGMVSFDLALIKHPLVKRKITQRARDMRARYSLDDHLDKLQEIRDAAFGDSNYKIALTAEIAVGKAAGLYEKITEDAADLNADSDLNKLSSEEIRRKLSAMEAPSPALPSPDLEEPDF